MVNSDNAGSITANLTPNCAAGTHTNSPKNVNAIGCNASTSRDEAVAIGTGTRVNAVGGIAVGQNAMVETTAINGGGGGGVAIGDGAHVNGVASIGLGYQSFAKGTHAIALGNAQAGADGAIAIGGVATTSSLRAVAIGAQTRANNDYDVAIGAYSATSEVTNVSGSRIAGVDYGFAGAASRGAVSFGGNAVGSIYTRQLQNVSAGQVTATSTDGVNGSQLFAAYEGIDATNDYLIALGSNVGTALGGGANYDRATHRWTGPTYKLKTGDYSNVADALAALDDKPGSSVDALLWSDSKGAYTASHADAATSKITDISNGALNASSTDAVNGSQLYATNQRVDENTQAISKLDSRVTNVEGDLTNLRSDVSLIDGRVTNIEGSVGEINNSVSNLTTTINQHGDQIAELDKASVKYTLDDDGNVTNEVNLTGDGTGTVALRNVSAGIDDTDAVNVGQLRDAVSGLSGNDPMAVRYVADKDGKPTNAVALTGDASGSPVAITNVAKGQRDTDAVNYGQVKNSLSYDVDADGNKSNTLTLSGRDNAAVVISNVADGIAYSDAVNLGQLNKGIASANNYTDMRVDQLREYTDNRLSNLSGDIRDVRDEARGGIAAAVATAQLRYGDRPGKVSVAAGLGGFKDKQAFAGGIGWTSEDQNWRFNSSVGIAFNGKSDVSWGVGVSYTLD